MIARKVSIGYIKLCLTVGCMRRFACNKFSNYTYNLIANFLIHLVSCSFLLNLLNLYKMETMKKYTAIQLRTETVNDNVNVKLSFGEITGTYYSTTHPTEEFDSEDEAIEYAYKFNKWGRWLIVPIVMFDTFGEGY